MKHLNLRTKFMLIIAAVFMLAAVAVLYSFSVITSRIVNEFALRVASRQALHDRNKILAIIDREVALSLKLADDGIIRRWVATGRDGEYQVAALEQLESYRRFFRNHNYFVARSVDLRYFNADHSAPPARPHTSVLSTNRTADSWYFDTLRKVETFALNLDYNILIRQAKLWINVIIRDDAGRKIGVGGTGLDLSSFLNEIVQNAETGTSTILIDGRGVIQAHRDQALVERNAQEQDAAKKITIFSLMRDGAAAEQLKISLRELAEKRQQVAVFPLELTGGRALAAAAYMPEIGWYNLVLVDVSHVLGSATFYPIMLISLLSLALVVAVIGYQVHRLVLQPLKQLNDASHAVAAGTYDVALPVRQQDEIGVLTESFNSMAATVRDHTAHLEERVRQRTAELTRVNEQLEASQARITESLQYARVIQASILPDPRRLDRVFREWSVLYQPCDIVGGDLYWLREPREGIALLAVLDCTGHGVPGAFMTMTVNAVLNHIVDTVCADDPSRILRETSRLLQETLRLRQDGDSLVDAGLDIGLCCIDTGQHRLSFAGAGISLYCVENGELREIRGDRQRVGYSGSDPAFVYRTSHLDLTAAACLYLTTDGFLDEGGGPHGYGFGSSRFRELLTEQPTLPLVRRTELFEQRITEWRGSRRQRDDITIFGFRL